MSRHGNRAAAAAAVTLAALAFGAPAQAQWGYPGGFGGCGWGGWGMGGGQTVQGSIAQGMGAFAMGAGFYNESTAVANSINTDTLMRFNQYMYESQKEANKNERERIARRAAVVSKSRQEIEDRLRNSPEPRDVYQGDALNIAVEDISDPRAAKLYLPASKLTVRGESIRNIPFQYAPGAITVSIHRLTQQPPPQLLLRPDFEADRAEIRQVAQAVRKDLNDGNPPDPAQINKLLAMIHSVEKKVDGMLPRNDRLRVEADRYLKALHGLVAMLNTPALDVITSGAEKRPEASLGELLGFMSAFNLRFGPATSPTQRMIYDDLFKKLSQLREQTTTALAKAEPVQVSGTEPGEFFQKMEYKDLQKKAPVPDSTPAPTPSAPAPAPPAAQP